MQNFDTTSAGRPHFRQEPNHRKTSQHHGFTILELLISTIVVVALSALAVVGYYKVVKAAKSAKSMSNIKQYVTADILFFNDHGEFPSMDGIVPSTMTRNRLAITADTLSLELPPGPVAGWPKRKDQPKWINCPLAIDSGYAEGVTLGGGVYTGYIYVGGIEESNMVKSRMGTVLHPGHSADKRNTHKGVLWASILDEFSSGSSRRFECFHYNTFTPYKDFRFNQNELTGMHRGWSDGSVEWLPASSIQFGGGSPDRQIKIPLGYYYY